MNFMRILAGLAALVMSHSAISCPKILGTWKSSKELSMDYNEKYAHLEPRQQELLIQILGRLIITYSENQVREHGQSPIKVTLDEKVSNFTYENLSYTYKVLSCNKTSVTVRFDHPFAGAKTNRVSFVDKDTYWVSPDILPSAREYFVRIVK